jgi:hypothetical protein
MSRDLPTSSLAFANRRIVKVRSGRLLEIDVLDISTVDAQLVEMVDEGNDVVEVIFEGVVIDVVSGDVNVF